MNIIVPIGGVGKRFKDEGYTQPKPLIKALGRSIIFWVLDNLDVTPQDHIFIIYRSEFSQYGFADAIKAEYPDKNIVTIPLFHNTSGAADTVKQALISDEFKEYLSNPVLVVDSDSYSEDPITMHLRERPKNIIYCHTDTNPEPKFSYVKTDGDRVVEIKEKVKISDRICIGNYAFTSGRFLLDTIKTMEEEKRTLGYAPEFYMSSIYAFILENKIAPIHYVDVNTFRCLGTPMQLQHFCNLKESSRKYRFCFDLDNTLVTRPTVSGDYNTVRPIEQNIQLLRKLYQQGHTIIIHSARHMRTTNGNLGSVMARVGQTVFNNLRDFDVPYHELYLGKPYAHFYIDDLAVNANDDLEKNLGFYNLYPPIRSHHNSIMFSESTVTKCSDNIRGEIWWYKNIPTELQKFFPRLHSATETELTIERISGIPLSYMLINQTLTEEHIEQIIAILRTIHNTKHETEQPLVNIADIYSRKFVVRTQQHDFSSYQDSEQVLGAILAFLREYEQTAVNNCIVHGDPVLTNIMYDLDHKFKFMDMRGCVGGTLSILGDPNYDYAKLYQSLCGYEYILLNRQCNTNYLRKLRVVLEKQFSQEHLSIVKMITANLFITLIPLHDEEKAISYYNLAHKLI